MLNVTTGTRKSDGARGLTPSKSYDLKPRIGYCADCGTWDAHGRFCDACGYDFMPAPEAVKPEPVA